MEPISPGHGDSAHVFQVRESGLRPFFIGCSRHISCADERLGKTATPEYARCSLPLEATRPIRTTVDMTAASLRCGPWSCAKHGVCDPAGAD